MSCKIYQGARRLYSSQISFYWPRTWAAACTKDLGLQILFYLPKIYVVIYTRDLRRRRGCSYLLIHLKHELQHIPGTWGVAGTFLSTQNISDNVYQGPEVAGIVLSTQNMSLNVYQEPWELQVLPNLPKTWGTICTWDPKSCKYLLIHPKHKAQRVL